MKKLTPVLILVGIAGVVAQCVGLPQLLKTGTCASGNTPFVIANQCPSGTGGTLALLGGGLAVAIIAMVVVGMLGDGGGVFDGPGVLLWGAEFVGVGATALIWALVSKHAQTGAQTGALIIGVVFIPMGAIPLAFGIRGALSGAESKLVSRRSKVFDAIVSGVVEVQSYGANMARVRITYAVTPPDAASFEVSRETNAVLSNMPQRGDHTRISYDPRHPDRFEVVSNTMALST